MLAETKSQTLAAQGPIADALRTQLGFDDDVLRKLDSIDSGDVLGISGDITFDIPVRNGRGEWNSPTLPTFWATVSGRVKILEPEGDSWYVRVRDTIAEKTVFEGTLKPGRRSPTATRPVSGCSFRPRWPMAARWTPRSRSGLRTASDRAVLCYVVGGMNDREQESRELQRRGYELSILNDVARALNASVDLPAGH